MATPRGKTYTAPSGATVYGGRFAPLGSLVPSGSIMSIALNTRDSVDPALDALANPNYPGTPPWDVIGGTAWSHTPDYSGAVFAADLGSAGTYLQYCATGHSANGATMWLGFDVASQTWQRVGRRPLPCNNLYGYVSGTTPASSQFDHTWGDWIGASTDWAVDFRQPGFNPPAGGHTRAAMTYRPAAQASNSAGQIVMGLACTGVNTGTTAIPGHYYDCDDGLFHRTSNQRLSGGSSAGNNVYDPTTDTVYGWTFVSSSYASSVDMLDCATWTHTRKSGLTNSPYMQVDASQAFGCGDLLVVCEQSTGSASFALKAIRMSDLKDGSATAWTDLTLSGTTWPSKSGETISIVWTLCPTNGVYYAVDRVTGSHTLYKLTPPGGGDAGNLSGTWTLSSETLAGDGLVATSWHYNRLQWCAALNAFLFTGESMTADTQAIRPIGI